MIQTRAESLYGCMHKVVCDKEFQLRLKKQLKPLQMRVSRDRHIKYNPNNTLITRSYHGEHAILLITTYEGINLSLYYIPKQDLFFIANYRFSESLHHENTQVYGELLENRFLVHGVCLRNDYGERILEGLEVFDQILYTKYKPDLILEPIQIKIKEFYNIPDMIPKGFPVIYLQGTLGGNHIIQISRGTS